MVQLNNLRSEYLENGFVIIKSMFDSAYIKKLRNNMIDLSKQFKKNENEILLDEDVQNLLINERLFKIIRKILNTDTLLYYSDSGVVNHLNPFKSQNGFHNDARGEDSGTPYEQEYPIIRVGIYFENYKDYSGGLKIKKGSHKYFCFTFRRFFTSLRELIKIPFSKTRYSLNSLRLAKALNLELEEGDIVIWNLRTHHCGTSRRLKFFPKLCLQPNIEKLIPSFFYLPTQYSQNRCAIFCTYAKHDLKDKNILGYLKLKTDKARLNQIRSDPKLYSKLINYGCKLPEKTIFGKNNYTF